MNVYEEQKKSQEEFIKSMNEALNSYLAEHNQPFNIYELTEFSKNVLYIDYENTSQGQKNIKSFLESLTPKITTAYNGDKQKTQEFLKSLYKKFPNTHIKGWGTFIDSVINFDDSKDYKSNIFERRFPVGTISYIGARPGRGKTTILINIALDALHQGKPVIFATAEETTKQILTRFILAETYARHEQDPRTVNEKFKPRTNLFNYIKDTSKTLPGVDITNEDFYGDSMQAIKDFIDSRKLIIFEAYGATWDELKDFLGNQEAGSVILIDYIQHLKSPAHLATQTRQIQIQETSHQLADLAGVHGLIMISGAQFNREAKNSNGKPDLLKADSFDETSFREAGDIEQDGHILIGIGKNPATEELFYSCMKDREASPDNGKCWKLKKNLIYSFLQGDKDDQGNRIEYIKQKKTNKEEKNGNDKPTEADKINAMKNYNYGGK